MTRVRLQDQAERGPEPRPQGRRAVLGAVIAVLGVLVAANPGSAVLRALYESAPVLADTLPTVITACGAVIAAFSQPPQLKAK